MSLIALSAGAAIALQSAMSGQLSKILNNASGAAFVVYAGSLVFSLPILYFSGVNFKLTARVPVHLWFVGGLLSVIALSSVYWLMPKMGVAKIMVHVQLGQILIAVVAGHFGWFDLPVNHLNAGRILGLLLMVGGVLLVNR